MIFDGRPSDGQFNKLIDEAIKEMPDWFLGEHTYKKLKTQSAAIAARQNMGKMLAELRLTAANKDTDKDTAEEAGWLLERLDPYAKGQLDKAKELVDKDPVKSLEVFNDVAKTFSGSPEGDEAAAKVKELKADEKFQKELVAAGILSKVELGMEKLQPCKNGQKLDIGGCPECKKRNSDKLGPLVAQLRTLTTKYEGTLAATEATTMLGNWGVK